jgi:hypothetical protein
MRRLPLIFVCVLSNVFAHAEEAPRIPFKDAPHNYFQREPQDAFSKLIPKLESGEVQLDTNNQKAHLISLLKALDVPATSQLLVYSATSLQSGRINPRNPRALYFNEEVYVGFVPGGDLEVSAIDPELGPVFHIFTPALRGGAPTFRRTDKCMNCHAGGSSWRYPGFTAESVIPAPNSGASLEGFRREIVGHTIPIKDRLGGWHVTGAYEHGDHLGNLVGDSTPRGVKRVSNPPGSLFEWETYPVQTSDFFTHLIHEHQLGFHNLVTLAVYRTREALEAGQGSIRSQDEAMLNDIARQFVRYLLFANEARLPVGGVKPDPAFLRDFLARKTAIGNGASLRDLDLRSRLFRYRCSYLIHTPGFAAIPEKIKTRILAGLTTALRETGGPQEFSYLPADEKRAIKIILTETKVLPAGN